MDWKDVGRTVAKVAPVLGSVLGGPVGIIAGAAGSLIGSVLGVEATPEAVNEALLKDPGTMLRLKEIEAAQQHRLLEWQGQQLNAELMNVQDARKREVELAKSGHSGAWVTGAVALVVILGFFWVLYSVVHMDNINEPALVLLGSLGTAFGAVVNYYLGSSLGSFSKNTMMTVKK